VYEAPRGSGGKGLYSKASFMSREVKNMGRPHKCPYCESTDSVSKGSRKTKTLGDRKIRRCKACHRKFTPKNQSSADPQNAPATAPYYEQEVDEPPKAEPELSDSS